MRQPKKYVVAQMSMLLAVAALFIVVAGCSTAPKAEDQATFKADAAVATQWFETHVSGLRQQMNSSAGYIIYPSTAQWGIIFGGGTYGRGTLNRPDGSQIGWAALNNASIGLQAGVRGFKMLVVFQDQATLNRFMEDKLVGSVSGVVVVAEESMSGKAKFENGVAVYQGASSGLMAGVNIGLDYMRYKPLGEG